MSILSSSRFPKLEILHVSINLKLCQIQCIHNSTIDHGHDNMEAVVVLRGSFVSTVKNTHAQTLIHPNAAFCKNHLRSCFLGANKVNHRNFMATKWAWSNSTWNPGVLVTLRNEIRGTGYTTSKLVSSNNYATWWFKSSWNLPVHGLPYSIGIPQCW